MKTLLLSAAGFLLTILLLISGFGIYNLYDTDRKVTQLKNESEKTIVDATIFLESIKGSKQISEETQTIVRNKCLKAKIVIQFWDEMNNHIPSIGIYQYLHMPYDCPNIDLITWDKKSGIVE